MKIIFEHDEVPSGTHRGLTLDVVAQNLGRIAILSSLLEKKIEIANKEVERLERRTTDLANAIEAAKNGINFYDDL